MIPYRMKEDAFMDKNVKEICYTGVFAALTVAATMIHIPMPATSGYINAGDAIILLIAFFSGSKRAAFSGAIGSALADLLLGYAYWVPITLVIKGVMGLTAGALFKNDRLLSLRNGAACVATEIVMIVGYFLGALPRGGVGYAAGALLSNTVQAVGGIIIFAALAAALKKAGTEKMFS
jgi:uncharacterized membrane protein